MSSISIHTALPGKIAYGQVEYKFNYQEALELLMAGADPNEKNQFGMTPLHILALHHSFTKYDDKTDIEIYKQLISLVISKSNDLNELCGKEGFWDIFPALYLAAYAYNTIAFNALLQAGADYTTAYGKKKLTIEDFIVSLSRGGAQAGRPFKKAAEKALAKLNEKATEKKPAEKPVSEWKTIDFSKPVNTPAVSIRHTLNLPHDCRTLRVMNGHYALVSGGLNPIKVSCIDLSDGSILWTQSFTSDTFSAPLYINGFIYVGIEDGSARFSNAALDFKTGQTIWKTYIANSYSTFSNGSKRIASNETLYYFSGSGTLFAYNITTGKIRFKIKVDKGDPWVTPILWRDRIIVQTTKRNKSDFVHYNASTGELIETTPLAKGLNLGSPGNTGDPIMVGDELWYVSTDNKLHCFDFATGKEKSSYDLPLKITNKVQYDYINASLSFNGHTFDIWAKVNGFAAHACSEDECDVSFDPKTGLFTTNPKCLDDKRYLCENAGYCYYEDYNMRPQFEYYITDATGKLIHSFSLPDKSDNVMGGLKVLANGTIVILQPKHDEKQYQIFIAY